VTAEPIPPDTKDWTWVLRRPCPECGFEPTAVHHTDVAAHIRADAEDWRRRLAGPEAGIRPRPTMWSPLEYGCHVRDVHRNFNHRARLMLAEHEPSFDNWDQDATAQTEGYASQDPAVVADELFDAASTVAQTYDSVPADAWFRRGLRGNGSEFTIATLAIYHLHEIVHHRWDVTRRRS